MCGLQARNLTPLGAINSRSWTLEAAVVIRCCDQASDPFGPADSRDRSPLCIHLDERILQLAGELID